MEDLYPDIQELLHIDEADQEEIDDPAPEQESDILENQIEEEHIQPALKLDYKLKTCEERAALVERIIEQTPEANLTNRYLEILGDYIMNAITKEEKKSHTYLTDNRLITVNKRETSFEGLVDKFENGEDGIYNLITNDKNIIFAPKISITEEDIEKVPGLKALKEEMKQIEEAAKSAVGRRKFLLKKQLIEMRRDQYILKNAYYSPMYFNKTSNKGINKIDLTERRWVDENGEPQSNGLVSFFNPTHISELLSHYYELKIETKGRYWDDFYYLLNDFDNLLHKALDAYPMYRDIAVMKMKNKTNLEIQEMLKRDYNTSYTVQYISQLWRKKIPKIISDKEKHDYLLWYYNEHKDIYPWKKCSCCQTLKPANSYFFTRNKTSKDGFYSICKLCRNKK